MHFLFFVWIIFINNEEHNLLLSSHPSYLYILNKDLRLDGILSVNCKYFVDSEHINLQVTPLMSARRLYTTLTFLEQEQREYNKTKTKTKFNDLIMLPRP